MIRIFIYEMIVDLLMGLDMELEFDKYCRVGASPKTVLPSPQRLSKVGKRRSIKEKTDCASNLLILEEGFTEINLHQYRSLSCKNIPTRTSGLEGNEALRRGSVYQSSREVRKTTKSEAEEGRRKIELSESRAINFSLGIVDNLCSSDEDISVMEPKIPLDMSPNSDNVLASDMRTENHLDSHSRDPRYAENVEIEKIEDPKFRCDPIVGPINDGNGLWERDSAVALHKSLSAKLALPHSPSQSESDSFRPNSPKSRFSPIKKMFDPFTKSKSQRSPLGPACGSRGIPSNIRRNNTLRKSLLSDFSNTSLGPDLYSQFVKKDIGNSAVSCSPAHLRGSLKLENKHGVPFFEFSLKFPEEVFVARTWKPDNALNWAYTFHCLHNRRKSIASGWGLKDWKKDSSLVGQMQVSCYLCTELKDAGAFNSSMVTEFVLYDVAHARQSVSSQENPNQSPDIVKPPKVSNQSSVGGSCELDEPKHAIENAHFDLPTSHPWTPTVMHPSLEIAAVVIQVPFEKRENLKHKGGDVKSDHPHPNLLDLSSAEQRKVGASDYSRSAKVNVVTTSGNHSLPCTESRGPSPLLDRWRLGGGCDCGGWDMACPLTVFDNPNARNAEAHPPVENRQPLELFVQGAKENTPALTMTVTEEGRYSVDFHAQLSTLQAFSICVAILHCTEASTALRWERDRQLLQCNSLRVVIGEEVKNLIEAVTEEEERKASKKMEEIPPPSFKPNPPFSPIARV
ncbi:bromo-adjacent domain protein, putative [Actinidia rufa]|uniref:Bromo-adjacent domain protein, putative n=1 Tax=Actinidia rufa TaxID=165716 RepID=A0A7J0DKJ7_9ERIC|nr:bromo-adjacent domain protein, putative [Actinidia rufa]